MSTFYLNGYDIMHLEEEKLQKTCIRNEINVELQGQDHSYIT
jgi:hypothetical protein